MNFRSARPQLPHLFVADQIRTGDPMARIKQQMTQAAHAAAASANEINRSPGTGQPQEPANLIWGELIQATTDWGFSRRRETAVEGPWPSSISPRQWPRA